jgi:hypothetical protein
MGKQKSREVVFSTTTIACHLTNYQVKIAFLREARVTVLVASGSIRAPDLR